MRAVKHTCGYLLLLPDRANNNTDVRKHRANHRLCIAEPRCQICVPLHQAERLSLVRSHVIAISQSVLQGDSKMPDSRRNSLNSMNGVSRVRGAAGRSPTHPLAGSDVFTSPASRSHLPTIHPSNLLPTHTAAAARLPLLVVVNKCVCNVCFCW